MITSRPSRLGRLSVTVALAIVATVASAALGEPTGYDGVTTPTADAQPSGDSYMLIDHWGGEWFDAEKSAANTDDDLMCWAAAAANILAWTGWGYVDDGTGHVLADADEIFAYFQAHWTDVGGLMNYGWDWWFDGTNNAQHLAGWSQVDSPGGGFYPAIDPDEYICAVDNEAAAMTVVDALLHDGWGVGIGIYRPAPGGGLYGHAVTVWGVNVNADVPGEYLGLWITDSDDDKYAAAAADRLRYYQVCFDDGQWFLQDYAGLDTWYIGAVRGLAVPEPAAALLLGAGALAQIRRRRGC